MKFKIKDKVVPSWGDTKLKTFFAFLPVRIDNEVRWLERVTVEYCFSEHIWEMGEPAYAWKKVKFIN